MQREYSILFCGLAMGMLVSAALNKLTRLSPEQVEKRYQKQAIELGHATNVIVLKDSEYIVQFNWISNK